MCSNYLVVDRIQWTWKVSIGSQTIYDDEGNPEEEKEKCREEFRTSRASQFSLSKEFHPSPCTNQTQSQDSNNSVEHNLQSKDGYLINKYQTLVQNSFIVNLKIEGN